MSLYFINKPRYNIVCCEYIEDLSSIQSVSDILLIDNTIKQSKADVIDFLDKRNYVYKINNATKRKVTSIGKGTYLFQIILCIFFDKKEQYSNLKLHWEPHRIDLS